MKKNIGNVDKAIRIIIGILIAAAGIYLKSWWGLLAIVPIATALVSFCGLYSIIGVSTCKMKEGKTA
jgi:hypothetical protein